MGWGRIQNIVVSNEDTTKNAIQEENLDDFGSVNLSAIDHAQAPTRTPMGEYIVPMGSKPLTSLGDAHPGPADYLPKMDLTKSSQPHYSIVGKPKRPDEKRHIPCPSQYNTSGDIKWKTKGYTLKGRTKSYVDEQAEKSISHVGKYKVEHKSFGREGPAFKMGIKTASNVYTGPANSLIHAVDTKGFVTPGPNYRPNSGYWGRGPQKSFGNRFESRKCDGPGPCDYDAQDNKRGPSYSFGMKLPEPVAIQQTVNKFSPAANTYDIGTTIGRAPAISITGRGTQTAKSREGPCPSSYYPRQKIYNKNRATTLAYKWFERDAAKRPGPADYDVTAANLRKSPVYTCREKVKTSYPDSVTYDKAAGDDPGPGAYNLVKDFVQNDNPAFSFRKRLEPVIDKESVPGPNAYESEKRSKPGAKRAPAFSMAKRLVRPKCNNPGPAEYYPKPVASDLGKYTMTKRPGTLSKASYVNPAPNLYSMPEEIARKNKGVVFKSRASPYVYSGYRTRKIEEPVELPTIVS